MNRIFRVPLIILLMIGTAHAADFSGQLKSTTDDYPYHLGTPTEDLVPYVSLELGERYRFGKSLRAQWKVFGFTNTSTQQPPENFYGDIPEAFLESQMENVRWRFGMHTVNWNVVDTASPSDVVNPVALFHPLRSFKQGAPMVESLIGDEALNIDLVYIPVQRPPQLPARDSRWLPRHIFIDFQNPQLGTIDVPKFLDYQYTHPDTMTEALNNNFGAKIASHIGALDVQLTHFEGVAPVAKIRPTVNVVAPASGGGNFILQSPTSLTPIYYRVRTTGFGFAWTLDKWSLRGETAYQHSLSQDAFIEAWSWSNALTLERTIDLETTTVTVFAQAHYTNYPRPPDNLISSSLYDHAGVLGASWTYSDDLTLVFSALYDTETFGWYWRAGFDNKLDEHLHWSASWNDFSAGKDGLLKTFEHNDYASMDLIYFF